MSQQTGQERTNYLIVMLMQAMLGLVSETLRGVALESNGDHVRLHFIVSTSSPEQRDDIEEIVGDFEAFLYPNAPAISVSITDYWPDADQSAGEYREVYRAKQQAPS